MEDFFANEKTGESDLKAAFDMQIMERERQLREFWFKINPRQQRNYDQAVSNLLAKWTAM